MKELIQELVNDIILSIRHLDEWYLSKVSEAVWEKSTYIVRSCKENVPGYEYSGDIARTYAISHEMFVQANSINSVQSYWCFEYEWVIYHVMSKACWVIKPLDQYLEQDIITVSQKLAALHTIKIDPVITWNTSLYKRSLREVFSNHETILSLYESEAEAPSPYLKKMLMMSFETYLKYVERDSSRGCVPLHGDFWHNNILIGESNAVSLIDFSRIPYWEAWIDVWHFLANLKIQYLLTDDKKYMTFYRIFLDTYIGITKDYEIEKYIQLSLLFVGWLTASNRIWGFMNITVEQKNMIVNEIL